jgi:putative ABC transport system permease protein
MIIDYFRYGFQSLIHRGLRSWLTMIGIFIGIAAVVALISLGQGFQKAINDQFEKLGSDRVIITAGSGEFGPMGSSMSASQLYEKDVDAVRKVQGVDYANGILFKYAIFKYKEETSYLLFGGTPTDPKLVKQLENMGFFEIEQGRELKGIDKYKVILGYSVAHETFKKKDGSYIILKPGDSLNINGKDFEIVGIQKKIGNGMFDSLARAPKDTVRELLSTPEEVSMIGVKVKQGYEPAQVADDIEKVLRKERNVKKGEEDFTVQTTQQVIGGLNSILNLVQIVIIGIAAISLFVGGIGIMNTMYTAVLERRKEIGIMKSVGARNSDILSIFLIESGLLGLAGGLIGVLIGFLISKLVELIAAAAGAEILKAFFSWYLVLGALLFSFLIGVLSGITPAIQASNMKPVDAMRE